MALSRAQVEELLEKLDAMIVKRRNLGGYSPEAPDIQFLAEAFREIVRERLERMPLPKKKKEDEGE